MSHSVSNFKLVYDYTPFPYTIAFAFEKEDSG
jgi:hypothetical protein